MPARIFVVIAWAEDADLRARAVAFGAVYSALSLIFLIFSATLGDDLFFLMVSSLPIIVIVDRMGRKTGLTSYLTVLILGFLLFPMRLSVMGFAMIFGPYALVRSFIPQSSKAKIVIRWFVLAGLSLLTYILFGSLTGLNSNRYAEWATVLLLAVGLVLYERLVEYFLIWYSRVFIRFSNRGR